MDKKIWKLVYQEAKQNTLARSSNDGVIIEIAAQHPLEDGIKPGAEFKARLDYALQLEKTINDKILFYVPGSRHKYKGIADKISLSRAGKEYLIAHGINEKVIFGDEINDIVGGVYNSNDECKGGVLLLENSCYGKLISICSPTQALRKELCYIRCNYLPEIHTVAVKNEYHNPIEEAFDYIPLTLKDLDDFYVKNRIADAD